MANEGRNGEFDDKVRRVRERKACKVQDIISAWEVGRRRRRPFMNFSLYERDV